MSNIASAKEFWDTTTEQNSVQSTDWMVLLAANRTLRRKALSSAGVLAILNGSGATAKAVVGLGEVNNTSDADKPISTAQQTALNAKIGTDAIDTLAKLNAILTDANLIDTNDARLSDARTPVSHTHTLSQLSDASANGRSLVGAADYAAMRTLLDVPATAHNHTLAQLSDASANGRSLMGAADYAAMRALLNVENGATADQTDTEIETAYNARVAQVSGGEITAGTATGIRRYSPADVKSFINQHAVALSNWEENGTTLRPKVAGYALGEVGYEVGDVVSNGRARYGDGSTASPSYAFTSDGGTGFYKPSGAAWGFASGSAESFRLEGVLGIGLRSTASLWWTSMANGAYSNRDLALHRDAANTLAQHNGANAQGYNIYNYKTSDSIYERAFMKWNSNTFEIGTEAAGGGVVRNLLLKANVGINQSSPAEKLDVNGNVLITTIANRGLTIAPLSIYGATSITSKVSNGVAGQGVNISSLHSSNGNIGAQCFIGMYPAGGSSNAGYISFLTTENVTSGGAVKRMTITPDGKVELTGPIGLHGVAPPSQAAAITSPAADVTELKTAVDAIRVALQNIGITA